jgi:hypothetical protein
LDALPTRVRAANSRANRSKSPFKHGHHPTARSPSPPFDRRSWSTYDSGNEIGASRTSDWIAASVAPRCGRQMPLNLDVLILAAPLRILNGDRDAGHPQPANGIVTAGLHSRSDTAKQSSNQRPR